MNSEPSQNIVIIGAGKVGTSLAHLLQLSDYSPELLGRGLEAQKLAVSQADIVFLTVADRDIESTANALSAYLAAETVLSHCSGALGSDVLASAAERGCWTASIHPLNSFPSLAAAQLTFSTLEHNSHAFAEGDERALKVLIPLFQQLGFHTATLASAQKSLYHAACVFACNYLTTLMEISVQTASQSGLDPSQFLDAIQPLVKSTLENIHQQGTAAALSGPIARGDHQTVAKHIDGLGKHLDVYKMLGRETLRLAIQRGDLNDEQICQLKKVLQAT